MLSDMKRALGAAAIMIAAAVAVLFSPAAFAQEYTLYSGYTISNLAFGEYVDPRDDQPGLVMHATVPDLNTDPDVFIPIADDLFEEIFLKQLAGADVAHAILIQWRFEPDEPTERRIGEEAYYDLGADGAWRRWSHEVQEMAGSSFGPTAYSETHQIAGKDVVLLPFTAGYMQQFGQRVILVRSALDIDLADADALNAFTGAFVAWQAGNADVQRILADNPGVGVVLSMSNNTPSHRFDINPTQSYLIPRSAFQ